jgi:pimeloyl-ACP methyl ester carboxylesterase
MTQLAEQEVVMVPTPSGTRIAARVTGPEDGRPVIALHGVMQTHDTVLKGHELEDSGFRVISYDARGHGASEAPEDISGYSYERLMDDLVAVMDFFDARPALLAGVSMGALTALRLAIEQPGRVAGIVAITPAYNPDSTGGCLAHAERVADALRTRDAATLIAASPVRVADPHHERALHVFARRTAERTVEAHRDPDATATALMAILRARAFESLEPLAKVRAPTIVVGSRDEFDVNHPLWLAEAYAAAIPGCRYVCEDEGHLPLAWKGREMAALVHELAEVAWP